MKQKTLTLFALAASAAASPLANRENGANKTTAESLHDVPLTKDLQWIPCYQNFTCVNLEVPLDYEDTKAGTTKIAFLKWPSPDQPAKGDVVFNPGGPGESAVEFLLEEVTRNMLTGLFGTAYNIIAMEPRGVGFSGPDVNCFKGQPAIRDYSLSETSNGFDPDSPQAMKALFQLAEARGEWCSRALGQEANYANTPATARDMLHYVELLATSQGQSPETAKLNYYGASYGTTLGMTFAQLYPNRVGHFIIDAVMDLDDHYGGAWLTNLLQADEAVESFNTFCYEAGTKCPFYRNDSSPADIKSRVDTILASLEETPIPVADPKLQFPTVVTHMDLRYILTTAVYSPIAMFPILASVLSNVEKRNGASLATFVGKGVMPAAACDNKSPEFSVIDPRLVIACNDQNGNYNISTMEKWYEYNELLGNYSTYLGQTWSQIATIMCRNLQISPPESQTWRGYKAVNTSHPILFTDNRIDPVTSSYNKMSALFPGSIVLLQDSVGHGMMAATSNCTTKYMTTYLETGELPPPNTMCEVPFNNPFDQPSSKPAEKDSLMRRRALRAWI